MIVFTEAMRMHPPMRALFRKCTKTYKIPDSDLVIDEGTLIFVPIEAIQMSPDVFPDPDKFNPDRFSPASKSKMHPCHWMPFGEGPRKCMGEYILNIFERNISEKTIKFVEFGM